MAASSELNIAALAFIGDAVYEVYVRKHVMETGVAHSDVLHKMAVEYTVNKALLARSERTLARFAYNNLLQDFVCSLSIRIARDMFALLPVRHTVVNTVMDGQVILSIDFDRDTLSRVKFGFIDPSDTVQRFPHAMQFTPDTGFYPVNTLI